MIVPNLDPDLTCQVLTDPDPTFQVISHPDPDRQSLGSERIQIRNTAEQRLVIGSSCIRSRENGLPENTRK